MSEVDLVIRGDVVTPDRVIADGYIAVSGEIIESVGEGTPPAAAEVQDCRGNWIIPGVVDGQTHAASQKHAHDTQYGKCIDFAGLF